MRQNKIFIFNFCRHGAAQQLSSIIRSNFDCDIQVVEERREALNLVQHRPDLFFLIEDEVITRGAFGMGELSAIPGILVVCTEGCKIPAADFLAEPVDDFIFTPLREAEILYRSRRLLGETRRDEKNVVQKNVLQEWGLRELIGQHPAFLETVSKIPQVAKFDTSVLLSGETGVGKEVWAREIHYLSKRANEPFIPVICGALPTHLVENELFGHRRGAFTDATQDRAGIVAEAEGGTLFLDEIDAIGMEAQSKLLRLLQFKTYRPLGQAKDVKADIRIIAATNVDLMQKIQEGAFRADLFYRLSVIALRLLPLRERKSDVPLLADYFLKKYTKEYDRGRKSLSSAAVRKLLSYDWPGNIRELENIIQQAVLFTPQAVIPPASISLPSLLVSDISKKLSFSEAKKKTIEEFEKEYLIHSLINCNGNITRASKEVGKDRRDFRRLMSKYRLDAKSFRHLN